MRAFVSSTYRDLSVYRRHVEDVLALCDAVYRGMEYFGSRPRRSLETCLREVERADIVICLVGTIYGSRAPSGLSYTRTEVEHATKCGVPVFPYFLDTSRQPVLVEHVARGSDAKALTSFQRWLKVRFTVSSFTTPEDLGVRLATDLLKLKSDHSTRGAPAFETVRQMLQASRAMTLDVTSMTALNLDRFHKVDKIAPDYETQMESLREAAGGSGANTVAALAKLGCPTAVAGIVNKGASGRSLIADLNAHGVDTSCVLRSTKADSDTGRTLIFVDASGHRTIFVQPGVNELWHSELRKRERAYLYQKLADSRIVHLSSFTGLKERALQQQIVMRLSEEHVISFTPGSIYARYGLDRLAPIIERTNVMFLYVNQLRSLVQHSTVGAGASDAPPIGVLERLFGWKAARKSLEPLIVVLKLSPMPRRDGGEEEEEPYLAVACGRSELEEFQPPILRPIDLKLEVKDATGAGDAAAAGILYGLLDGTSVGRCANLGLAMALSASSAIGSRKGLPSLRRLRQLVGS